MILEFIKRSYDNGQIKDIAYDRESNQIFLSDHDSVDNTINLLKFLEGSKQDLILEAALYLKKHKTLISIEHIIDELFTIAGIDKSFSISRDFFSNWMSTLPAAVKDKPITNVLIPGTNNSAANKIDWNLFIEGESSPDFSHYKSNIFHLFFKSKLEQWNVYQKDSIYEQLMKGIRFFDIKISYNQGDKQFYVTNKFTISALSEVIKDFEAFLDRHSSEMIFINLNFDPHFRGYTEIYKDRVQSLIMEHLGHYLVSGRNELEKSLNELLMNDRRVVLFSERVQDFILDRNEQYWINISNIMNEDIIDINKYKINENNNRNAIDYHRIYNNTDMAAIFTFPDLQSSSALRNEVLTELIGQYPGNNYNVPSGIIMDFPTLHDIEIIINYNL